mgnify:CR=1 FL=1
MHEFVAKQDHGHSWAWNHGNRVIAASGQQTQKRRRKTSAGVEQHLIRSQIERVQDVEYTITDSVSEALLRDILIESPQRVWVRLWPKA